MAEIKMEVRFRIREVNNPDKDFQFTQQFTLRQLKILHLTFGEQTHALADQFWESVVLMGVLEND